MHAVFRKPALGAAAASGSGPARKARAMMSILPSTEGGAHWRWLLLGSLALNLFFVGAAGAVAIRYSGPVPLTPIARIDHSLAGRLDRIAAKLPPGDAEVLRAQLRDEELKVAAAEADLRLSQEEVRKTLRAQPFDAEAVRTAMAASRDRARQFRSGHARYDRRRRRQNVGRRPDHAGGLADRSPRRRAPGWNLLKAARPRCGGLASRSSATRVRQWCRRDRIDAAIQASHRRAPPSR